MKKNKKILIIIIVAIILLTLTTFMFNYKKANTRHDVNYIYECGGYGYEDKFYNLNDLGEISVSCERKEFTCKNCEIFDFYYKDKIIYKSGRNHLVVYNLKDKKVINKIKVKPEETYYKSKKYDIYIFELEQDEESFGFEYVGSDGEEYFYSLENDKITKLNEERCNYKLEGVNYLSGDLCRTNENMLNIIHNDRVIVRNENNQFSILNLKTGKHDIQNQKYIIHDNYSFYNNEKEKTETKSYYLLEYNILDSNLKPIFSNDLKVHPLKMISDELIIAYDEALDLEKVLIFFNSKGEEIYRISLDVIGYEIYKKIENSSLKNSITVRDIAESLANNINITYEDNLINLNFYYQNDEYNEYIDLYYKYHIKSKYLEEYEIDYEEEW